jgi:hypothetical protein
MQVTLDDAQYERLHAESLRTGLGLAELVGRAVDKIYGPAGADEFREAVTEALGAWSGRDSDGEAYVEQIRRARSGRFSESVAADCVVD